MAALLLAVCGGCQAPADNSVLRSARDRQTDATHADRARRQGELQIVRQQTADTMAAITAAKAETVQKAAQLRAVLVDLEFELERLHRAERDLEAARARSLAVEEQMQPLRLLEQALLEQERRRAETAQRLAALAAEVEAAERTAAGRQADLHTRLAALQSQVAAAQKFEAAMAAALAAAAEVLQALAPPPAADAPPK